MTSHVPQDDSLTEVVARTRTLGYLTDTLRDLPPQVGLSWQHPSYEAVFGDAFTLPCTDDDTIEDPPLRLSADYWVVGVPPDQVPRYFGLVLDAWDRLGWQTARDGQDPDITYGRARTPDGYSFKVVDNGTGSMSVSAGSPCFPRRNAGGGSPLPETIVHPPG